MVTLCESPGDDVGLKSRIRCFEVFELKRELGSDDFTIARTRPFALSFEYVVQLAGLSTQGLRQE